MAVSTCLAARCLIASFRNLSDTLGQFGVVPYACDGWGTGRGKRWQAPEFASTALIITLVSAPELIDGIILQHGALQYHQSGELSLDPNITVIIVYWKSAEYLSRCLSALSKQTYRDFEVILIDNAADRDLSPSLLGGYADIDVHLKRLEVNRGFAAANNIGSRLARGHWLALLNSDAFPRPDWLERLVAGAEENPSFCSFASRQLRADKPHLLDGAGDVYHVGGLAWRRYREYPAASYGLESEEVFSACAAAAMYRRDAFLQAGGFDEDFFNYYEDVDLGFRLRLRGYTCLYVPDAVVEHIGWMGTDSSLAYSLYYWHRNLIWAFLQNMPSEVLWRALPLHLMTHAIYQAYHLFQGYGRVVAKAQVDALRGLPRAWHKRKRIQKERHISTADLLGSMERGVLDPFLKDWEINRFLRPNKPLPL
jgi:GT2 family glycosyltransferase